MTATPRQQTFKVGDRVEKVGGRYGGPGRVVGVSEELDESGYRLFMVAMRVDGGYGEFVHVFPTACLRHAAPITEPAGDVIAEGLPSEERLDSMARRIDQLEKAVRVLIEVEVSERAMLRGEGTAEPLGILLAGSPTKSSGTGGGE